MTPCFLIYVNSRTLARYKITEEVASSRIAKEFSNDDSEDAHRRHEGQFVHVHSTAQEGESPVFSLIPNAADESIAAGKPMQQYLNIKKVNRIGARKNFILFLVQLHGRRIDPADAVHNGARVQIAVEIHISKDEEVINVSSSV